MKYFIHRSLLSFFLISIFLGYGNINFKNSGIPFAYSAEDWKGESDKSQMDAGALAGMGIIGSSSSFALLGTLSKKIVPRGFIPDINDSVSIEGFLGPVFQSGSAWIYSAHLRWDFIKDEKWTLYGLGGVGGSITNYAGLSQFILSPRFGVGAFLKLQEKFYLRGDIAHDLIAVGINFKF